MLATATTVRQPFRPALKAFGILQALAVLTRRRDRAMTGETEAEMDRLSLRTRDGLGLLSGEGCVTDRGLLERAERLRTGWA